MEKKYPSHITHEQFEKIAPLLLSARKITRPRQLDLYQVFCAILFLLKTGCQWRMLPNDFPKWQSVYFYFRIWSTKKNNGDSLLEQALKKLVEEARTNNGRSTSSSFCIIDAQSVKNTDTANSKGYDANKKISGIKRHIAVDTQGLPHAIHITTANVTDRNAAIAMIGKTKERLAKVKTVLCDGAYTGAKFATQVKNLLGAKVQIAKRSELSTFTVIPKRWVVERSFAWLQKYRRLWKNCERKITTSLQMVVLGFLSLKLKRF